jgi:hypothetical protein
VQSETRKAKSGCTPVQSSHQLPATSIRHATRAMTPPQKKQPFQLPKMAIMVLWSKF